MKMQRQGETISEFKARVVREALDRYERLELPAVLSADGKSVGFFAHPTREFVHLAMSESDELSFEETITRIVGFITLEMTLKERVLFARRAEAAISIEVEELMTLEGMTEDEAKAHLAREVNV
jgi:hypothetical protein